MNNFWQLKKVTIPERESVVKGIKHFTRILAGPQGLYDFLQKQRANHKLRKSNPEDIFTDIFHGNKFGGTESVSGIGSGLSECRIIIEMLPILLQEMNVASILDIPCGDFNWMNRVNLGKISYIGADIVKILIQKNRKKYSKESRRFLHLDIITDPLPKVDLVFCRDLFVHFCFKDIFKSLHNIIKSKSLYLLTTTFPSKKVNNDILTGRWRTLNLEIFPFHFPKPLKMVNEEYEDDRFKDKSLGLWKIADISRTPSWVW